MDQIKPFYIAIPNVKAHPLYANAKSRYKIRKKWLKSKQMSVDNNSENDLASSRSLKLSKIKKENYESECSMQIKKRRRRIVIEDSEEEPQIEFISSVKLSVEDSTLLKEDISKPISKAQCISDNEPKATKNIGMRYEVYKEMTKNRCLENKDPNKNAVSAVPKSNCDDNELLNGLENLQGHKDSSNHIVSKDKKLSHSKSPKFEKGNLEQISVNQQAIRKKKHRPKSDETGDEITPKRRRKPKPSVSDEEHIVFVTPRKIEYVQNLKLLHQLKIPSLPDGIWTELDSTIEYEWSPYFRMYQFPMYNCDQSVKTTKPPENAVNDLPKTNSCEEESKTIEILKPVTSEQKQRHSSLTDIPSTDEVPSRIRHKSQTSSANSEFDSLLAEGFPHIDNLLQGKKRPIESKLLFSFDIDFDQTLKWILEWEPDWFFNDEEIMLSSVLPGQFSDVKEIPFIFDSTTQFLRCHFPIILTDIFSQCRQKALIAEHDLKFRGEIKKSALSKHFSVVFIEVLSPCSVSFDFGDVIAINFIDDSRYLCLVKMLEKRKQNILHVWCKRDVPCGIGLTVTAQPIGNISMQLQKLFSLTMMRRSSLHKLIIQPNRQFFSTNLYGDFLPGYLLSTAFTDFTTDRLNAINTVSKMVMESNYNSCLISTMQDLNLPICAVIVNLYEIFKKANMSFRFLVVSDDETLISDFSQNLMRINSVLKEFRDPTTDTNRFHEIRVINLSENSIECQSVQRLLLMNYNQELTAKINTLETQLLSAGFNNVDGDTENTIEFLKKKIAFLKNQREEENVPLSYSEMMLPKLVTKAHVVCASFKECSSVYFKRNFYLRDNGVLDFKAMFIPGAHSISDVDFLLPMTHSVNKAIFVTSHSVRNNPRERSSEVHFLPRILESDEIPFISY